MSITIMNCIAERLSEAIVQHVLILNLITDLRAPEIIDKN